MQCENQFLNICFAICDTILVNYMKKLTAIITNPYKIEAMIYHWLPLNTI